jgi:anti-anti-sigma factor
MEIIEQIENDLVILKIKGRLDTSNYTYFEERINELINGGTLKILVDCSDMVFISSSGLRVFLVALKRLTTLKGRLVISALNENIAEIFSISGFTGIFEIFPHFDQAVKSFKT